ncbi:MAG: hypothetical protein H0A75_08110 [Candidatus Methanofishera endochildressiae]|uniref:Uncharacterized protein n=1 Tax=Candidatus Methanofishera endochildressiae TaxID=2738884 RepID=A0A7Z0MQ69_9GAMM|nr:hypothetical protein [Candidatus Methanofishera endochildressiae]
MRLLEVRTYSVLLKEASEHADAREIQELWENVPEHVKTMSGVPAMYYAAMIEAGAGAKIEKNLVKSLNNKWDVTLRYWQCSVYRFSRAIRDGRKMVIATRQ